MIKLDMIQLFLTSEVLMCDNVTEETIFIFEKQKPKNLKLARTSEVFMFKKLKNLGFLKATSTARVCFCFYCSKVFDRSASKQSSPWQSGRICQSE